MSKDNRAAILEITALLFLLALSYYLIFIPHLNYQYPLHHDEWMHMAFSKAIMKAGSIFCPEPFIGDYELSLSNNPETGYHVILGIFQSITGIPWSKIILYVPGIIFILTVLSVYIFARREGYGLAAAFFTCLIPTFRGTLGPAFMVPMALALPFIPLSILLTFNFKNWQSYLLLFLFSSLILSMHYPTAIILVIILFPYILLNLKDNRRHSLAILCAIVLPFVISLPWTVQTVSLMGVSSIQQELDPYITLPPLFQAYGYIPMAIGLLGLIALAYKGKRNDFTLLFSLLALVLMLVTFYRFHFGHPILHARGLTSMLLLLSIIAGAGLLWIYKLKIPYAHTGQVSSFPGNRAGALVCLPLLALSLFFSVNSHYNTYYYHMIEQEDYQAFVWMRDNIETDSLKTLLDPWKATVYTAVTGNTVTSRIFIHPEPLDIRIYEFLQNGCADTGFLRDNGIGIVYSQMECNNTDLASVRQDVYITSPDLFTPDIEQDGLKNSGFEYLHSDELPSWWGSWYQNCSPNFLYPEPGRNDGTSVAINMNEVEPFVPWPLAAWIQDADVEAGKIYVIGGWIRTENIVGDGGAMIIPHWKNSKNRVIDTTEHMSYVKNTSKWTYYQYEAVAPQGADYCSLLCVLAGSSGTAWFDDITFQEEIERPSP